MNGELHRMFATDWTSLWVQQNTIDVVKPRTVPPSLIKLSTYYISLKRLRLTEDNGKRHLLSML